MKGSCDSMAHLANESFLTKEQQDRIKGTFDDFVAVVRCKDCKHATMTADGKMCKYCKARPDECGYPIEVYYDADWFCADGERKTNDAWQKETNRIS